MPKIANPKEHSSKVVQLPVLPSNDNPTLQSIRRFLLSKYPNLTPTLEAQAWSCNILFKDFCRFLDVQPEREYQAVLCALYGDIQKVIERYRDHLKGAFPEGKPPTKRELARRHAAERKQFEQWLFGKPKTQLSVAAIATKKD